MANLQLTDFVSINRGGTPGDGSLGTYYVGTVGELVNQLNPQTYDISGGYRVANNQVSSWGSTGPKNNTATLLFETVTDWNLGNLNNNSLGGIMLPFDVKVTEIGGFIDNSSATLEAYGLIMVRTAITDNSNVEVHTKMLDELVGVPAGPRNYLNTVRHKFLVTQTSSDIGTDFISADTVPAGDFISFGVAAPTVAITGDARLSAAYMKFEVV